MSERVKKYLPVLELSYCRDAISFRHSKTGFLFNNNIMETEIWKDVIGYEGSYQVSNLGRVKSLRRKSTRGNVTGVFEERILKPGLGGNGYLYVSLYTLKKQKSFPLHRLVTLTFFSCLDSGLQVNHKDGNKLNNNLCNLEFCTASENIKHAYKSGLMKASIGNAKLNKSQIKEIRNSSLMVKDLAKEYNVTKRNIYDIRNNKTWKHL